MDKTQFVNDEAAQSWMGYCLVNPEEPLPTLEHDAFWTMPRRSK